MAARMSCVAAATRCSARSRCGAGSPPVQRSCARGVRLDRLEHRPSRTGSRRAGGLAGESIRSAVRCSVRWWCAVFPCCGVYSATGRTGSPNGGYCAGRMPTVDVRLDRLERDVAELLELIHGGPSVAWERSIRGRLHAMRSTDTAAAALADALREVRRERSQRWGTWQKTLLVLSAVVTAAASVYAALSALPT